jgi:hypothetical protein
VEYVGLALLLVAPVAAAIAAYATELGRLALFGPQFTIAVGYWIAYGWFNVGGLGVSRGIAAFLAGLYALAWLILCHLLVSAARALRSRVRH